MPTNAEWLRSMILGGKDPATLDEFTKSMLRNLEASVARERQGNQETREVQVRIEFEDSDEAPESEVPESAARVKKKAAGKKTAKKTVKKTAKKTAETAVKKAAKEATKPATKRPEPGG